MHINIGPNTSPLLPPGEDNSSAVLVIEANTGISNHLRTQYQAKYVDRFFVLNSAVSSDVKLAKFNFYNSDGRSSSLSTAAANTSWSSSVEFGPAKKKFGPGALGYDLVTVITLDMVINSIPTNINIPLLKIDTQGHDFEVITSASMETLRRVDSVVAETYLPDTGFGFYQGVRNELVNDWIPYMKRAGFLLQGDIPGRKWGEYDAIFNRSDLL